MVWFFAACPLVGGLKIRYKKSVGTLLVLFEVSANTHALTNNLTTLFAAHKEWQKRSRPDCPSAF